MAEMKRIDRRQKVRHGFHQAKWDEPVIFELSIPGERGVLVPKADRRIREEVGEIENLLPAALLRKTAPALPEISQPRVLRHYMRLSQETLGADFNVEIGQGTCTMKYSPKINDQLSRLPQMADLHPLQDESTVQGILHILHETDRCLCEISGMSRFSFQPGSGSQAALLMASLVRAYFTSKGEGTQRTEVITTQYSHPSDAAAPHVAGYKIIHIPPDKDGYPDWDAFQATVSEKTAAFLVANPEDTGLYNSRVQDFTRLVHEKGGLCCYDQANVNGLLGVTRAKEAGFDMCYFNLHKSFSAPHGCGGPACGATGVVPFLIPFLPGPIIQESNGKYHLAESESPYAVGKVRSYQGAAQVVLKAYAWIRALGAEGLYQVAKTAVLNNNYLYKKLLELPEVSVPYIPEQQRVEQCRYSLETLYNETGVDTVDVQRRIMDFGMHYWQSHHPWYVPQPMTLEPTETPSKADIDEYIETLKTIFAEAHTDPETVKTAPHRSVCAQLDESNMDDPGKWAITWRSYLRKYRPAEE